MASRYASLARIVLPSGGGFSLAPLLSNAFRRSEAVDSLLGHPVMRTCSALAYGCSNLMLPPTSMSATYHQVSDLNGCTISWSAPRSVLMPNGFVTPVSRSAVSSSCRLQQQAKASSALLAISLLHLQQPFTALQLSGPCSRTFMSGFGGSRSPQDWLQQMLRNGAPYTNVLIAVNVAAFLLQQLSPGFTTRFALVNAFVSYQHEWWRLVTSAFLHLGFIHVAVNMYTLYLLAPPLEHACGSNRFLLIYFISAFTGSLMQYSFTPMTSSSLGSSTALAGTFGAFVVYKYRNRAFVGFDQGDISWVAQVLGLNLLLSVMGGSSIGHWAHLGGLLGGSAAMLLLGPRYVWNRGQQVDDPLIPLPKWLLR